MNKAKGLLPLMGMNLAVWGVIAACGLHTAPAHAISAAYRAELERTHTTMVQQVHQPVQQAPAYKPGHLKPIHVKKFGQDFKRSPDGFAYLNGSVCAQDEVNAQATVYSSGTYTIIVRKSGKVDLMNNGRFVGHMN
ncbi:hypothetical protein ZL58_14475 [Salmonella enterica subsp. enterica serovar Typhimurium]|nr:hypothetical protein [Salmonella enterica subsp. enterica serovar Typhimurium]